MTQENKTSGTVSVPVRRKRKILLVLPLLVIPFLTIAFWALGGGSAVAGAAGRQPTGLNLELPTARLKDDKAENKLTDYERADRDSEKLSALRKADPLFEMSPGLDSFPQPREPAGSAAAALEGTKDPNVARVYEKLGALNRQLNAPSQDHLYTKRQKEYTPARENEPAGMDAAYSKMKQNGGEPDPELDRLDQMMDKVIRIQHPEENKPAKPASRQGLDSGHLVQTDDSVAKVELMGYDTVKGESAGGGFYGLEQESSVPQEDHALPARVYGAQTLVSGAMVKLCTEKDLQVLGVVIPKGTFLYGVSKLEGERLLVHVSSVRVGEALYPVRLSVFDLDGQEGIAVPGSIGRAAVKGSTDQMMGAVGLTTLDPSLAAQAAAAGIQAARSLLSKKVKVVKLTLTAGYEVLLKNQ